MSSTVKLLKPDAAGHMARIFDAFATRTGVLLEAPFAELVEGLCGASGTADGLFEV